MTVFLNIVQESQELLGSLRHAVRGINRLREPPPHHPSRNDRRETDTRPVSVSRPSFFFSILYLPPPETMSRKYNPPPGRVWI